MTWRRSRSARIDALIDGEISLLVVTGKGESCAPGEITLEQRQSDEPWEGSAGWAQARTVLRALAKTQCPGSRVEVGRAEYLQRGLFRTAYVADLEVEPDPLGLSTRTVTLLPHEPMDVSPELRWLAVLRSHALPFEVPRPLGATTEGILVVSCIPGLPLRKEQWADCVRVAAALHRLPLSFEGDRTQHALKELEELRASKHPEVAEAIAWCEAHLPSGPLVLTHGDLLPQNVLWGLQGERGVIDWQFAGPGDPAQELAILTRGARRPFGVEGGLSTVVEAYLEAGGVPVREEHVLFYELCMVASWLNDEGFDHHRDRLRAVLRRAKGRRS